MVFRRKNKLEISPIVSSEDEETEILHTETIKRIVANNDKLEYKIIFDWGPKGEVEIRTVK